MTKKKKLTPTVDIPCDVSEHVSDEYVKNLTAITKGAKRLFMFAADQKIEHLNHDFYGPNIDAGANNPEHIFRIAEQGSIGALATHAGLIARYGRKYQDIDYIVKLNGKTNLVNSKAFDPLSAVMWDIQNVFCLMSENNLNIRGIGYTVYLGSEYEHIMLARAAQAVIQAHQAGLVAVLWIYPRARHITDSATPDLIAGAAGIGNALGADFVKVHVPSAYAGKSGIQALKIATQAAGNTGVICSGGEFISTDELLKNIHEQIFQGGASGCAIGRNIFQRPYEQALALTKAISAIVYNGVSFQEAKKILDLRS